MRQKQRSKLGSRELLRRLEELPIRYTLHALERLKERRILQVSVSRMLRGKAQSRFHDPARDRFEAGAWKYRIHGADEDGHKLAAVVAVHDEVIVVTVFGREESR